MNYSSNDAQSRDNIYIGILYLTLSVLTILSNSVIIVVTFISRELHLPPLWTIASMAVWDLAFAFVSLAVATPSAFLGCFPYPDYLIPGAATIVILIGSQQVLNTTMTVMDHFLAVRFPMKYPRIAMKYPRIATTRNYSLAFTFSLILNICHLLMFTLSDTTFIFDIHVYQSFVERTTPAIIITTSCFILFPCVAIVGASVPVLRNIRSSARVVSQSVIPNTNVSMNLCRFPLMVFISASAFCLAYFPLSIYVTLKIAFGKDYIPLFRFGIFTLQGSSQWNLFIYVGTYRPFRDALLKMFCRTYYRRRRRISVLNVPQ